MIVFVRKLSFNRKAFRRYPRPIQPLPPAHVPTGASLVRDVSSQQLVNVNFPFPTSDQLPAPAQLPIHPTPSESSNFFTNFLIEQQTLNIAADEKEAASTPLAKKGSKGGKSKVIASTSKMMLDSSPDPLRMVSINQTNSDPIPRTSTQLQRNGGSGSLSRTKKRPSNLDLYETESRITPEYESQPNSNEPSSLITPPQPSSSTGVESAVKRIKLVGTNESTARGEMRTGDQQGKP
jgi:hypothetical protein